MPGCIRDLRPLRLHGSFLFAVWPLSFSVGLHFSPELATSAPCRCQRTTGLRVLRKRRYSGRLRRRLTPPFTASLSAGQGIKEGGTR